MLHNMNRTTRGSDAGQQNQSVDPSTPPLSQRDLYEVLGVTKVSSEKEIRIAYRKLALRYHPDKNVDNPEAAEIFKAVAYANGILSDPEKRRKYDASGFQDLDKEEKEMEIDLSSLGFVSTAFAATFSLLGVPIKTTVSVALLEKALGGDIKPEPLQIGEYRTGKVNKCDADFYVVDVGIEESNAGIIIRVTSSTRDKFKLLHFERDGCSYGMALQEDSEGNDGSLTLAGMYFLHFPVYHMDSTLYKLQTMNDPRNNVFKKLEALQPCEIFELKLGKHIFAVYGDNFLKHTSYTIEVLCATSFKKETEELRKIEEQIQEKKYELRHSQLDEKVADLLKRRESILFLLGKQNLKIGENLPIEVDKHSAKFFTVDVGIQEANTGIIIKVTSSTKDRFKLRYSGRVEDVDFSLDLQVREDTSTDNGEVTSAELYLSQVPDLANSTSKRLRTMNEPKLDVLKRLEGLPYSEIYEMKPGRHVFCVHGDNLFKPKSCTIQALCATSFMNETENVVQNNKTTNNDDMEVQKEDSEKKHKMSLAGMYFLRFPVYGTDSTINLIENIKDKRPLVIERLENLQRSEITELKPGTHVFAVYGDNFSKSTTYTIEAVTATSRMEEVELLRKIQDEIFRKKNELRDHASAHEAQRHSQGAKSIYNQEQLNEVDELLKRRDACISSITLQEENLPKASGIFKICLLDDLELLLNLLLKIVKDSLYKIKSIFRSRR